MNAPDFDREAREGLAQGDLDGPAARNCASCVYWGRPGDAADRVFRMCQHPARKAGSCYANASRVCEGFGHRNQCECCGRDLDPVKTHWLELSTKTGRYSEPFGALTVPADESQGCFPFGAACARKVLRNGGRIKQ